MPPRNKRKRLGKKLPAVKPEPPGSDAEVEWQGPAKRVKVEEVKVLGENVIVDLSESEASDSLDEERPARPAALSVRRSAGGRAPRRGTDVAQLYEEVGLDVLPRSLGQVVKEEIISTPAVAGVVKEESGVAGVVKEEGVGSPLRVSDSVRRAAARRVEQMLRPEDDNTTASSVGRLSSASTTRAQRQEKQTNNHRRKFTKGQRAALRVQFEIDNYPDRATKEELSQRTGLSYSAVRNWFDRERRRSGVVGSGTSRARRLCRFGPAAYDTLMRQFELNPRPSLETRRALAKEFGGTLKQISRWFKKKSEREGASDRKMLSLTQSSELLKAFQDDPHPDMATRATLAEKFGCHVQQISSWFMNRRQRKGFQSSKEDLARRACVMGPEAYDTLVAAFAMNRYPDRATMEELANWVGGTYKQVACWFRARRRHRKECNSENYMRLPPAAFDLLVARFEEEPYPDIATRKALAEKISGTLQQVSTWFMNRRRRSHIDIHGREAARRKCTYGPEVFDKLVAQLEIDSDPDRATKLALAASTGLTSRQIRDWFARRRSRGSSRGKADERD